MKKIPSAPQEREPLFVGDKVRVIKYKFPELHPEKPIKKVVYDFDVYNRWVPFYYTFQGLHTIGLEGHIIEVRTEPYCQYEIETGEIQKYVVRFTSGGKGWVGKKLTFYPEEVQRIKVRNPFTQKDLFLDSVPAGGGVISIFMLDDITSVEESVAITIYS